MRGKYDPNTAALLGLAYLILILGLANHNANTSQSSQWLFFISIACLCIYMIFFCASSDPISDLFSAYPIALLFFNSLDYILLRKYQPELQPSGQKPLSEMPLKDRLCWAANLSVNPRGIGWTHEPTRHLPHRPSSTPSKFILSQLMWMVFYALISDIINIVVHTIPCFAAGGPTFTSSGWLWRSTVWLIALSGYCMSSLLYTAYSIVSVTIGMTEPRDWPRLFGSPLDAYTLRNCWGWVDQFSMIITICLKMIICKVVSGTKCCGKWWQLMLILSPKNYGSGRALSGPASSWL